MDFEDVLAGWDGEHTVVRYDAESGAWMFVCVHSTARGPAGGGTRMRVYPGEGHDIVVVVSMFTKPRPESELNGLVYGATVLPKEEPVPFYKREWTWAIAVIVMFAILNILFW